MTEPLGELHFTWEGPTHLAPPARARAGGKPLANSYSRAIRLPIGESIIDKYGTGADQEVDAMDNLNASVFFQTDPNITWRGSLRLPFGASSTGITCRRFLASRMGRIVRAPR